MSLMPGIIIKKAFMVLSFAQAFFKATFNNRSNVRGITDKLQGLIRGLDPPQKTDLILTGVLTSNPSVRFAQFYISSHQ